MWKKLDTISISLKAQDAWFLVDLIGLCRTPKALVRYWSFTERLVPQVSRYIQEFNKEATQFDTSARALYDSYYTQETDVESGEKKSVLKPGKTIEDFNNTYKGLTDEFQVKADKLKLAEEEYKFDWAEFESLIDIFLNDIDLSMSDKRKDEKPELFTAQLYSIAKELSGYLKG